MKNSIKTRCARLLTAGMLMAGGLFMSSAAQAEVACSTTMNPVDTVTLNGTFYVGNDLPNGSVLYRATAHTGQSSGVTCDGAFSLAGQFSANTEPSGAPFSLAGAPYNGQIYPTNVKGIGVALWYAGNTFTKESPYGHFGYALDGSGSSSLGVSFDMSLIKTGPVDSGAVVNGVSIPQVIMSIPPTPGYSGLPLTVWTVNFNGALHFTTQTCQTPDVNVDMGSYEKTKYFKGVGSTTPWIDSSIQLQNCPTFTGYHNDQNPQNATGTATATGDNVAANMLKVSLHPIVDIIDNANGVIGVNANGTSGSAATGIGIQLGYSPDNINASPTAPANIWKDGDAWTVTPPNDGSQNFRIPLAARYYQVNNVVTPGPANSQVTFVIDYQ